MGNFQWMFHSFGVPEGPKRMGPSAAQDDALGLLSHGTCHPKAWQLSWITMRHLSLQLYLEISFNIAKQFRTTFFFTLFA